jgi:hypothetical protein
MKKLSSVTSGKALFRLRSVLEAFLTVYEKEGFESHGVGKIIALAVILED